MIKKYLNDLDAFISGSPAVVDVEIMRRDVRDTGFEKIALYRYRLKLKDGSTFEITERLVEESSRLEITKYRYHWQDSTGNLIKRWDNAPHHPEIDTFPNHLHISSDDRVVRFEKLNMLKILMTVIDSIPLDP